MYARREKVQSTCKHPTHSRRGANFTLTQQQSRSHHFDCLFFSNLLNSLSPSFFFLSLPQPPPPQFGHNQWNPVAIATPPSSVAFSSIASGAKLHYFSFLLFSLPLPLFCHCYCSSVTGGGASIEKQDEKKKPTWLDDCRPTRNFSLCLLSRRVGRTS